ncbi:MAG: 50S ribosomal protein L15 [Flavobacteriales bacterium Tduv]
MRLNNLNPAAGAVKQKKRLGRGQGSGKGATSTRGHKGAKSRSGNAKKIGFEGGQMPLQRRIPKFGFKNPNRKVYIGINLDILQSLSDLGKLKDGVVDRDSLLVNGFIGKNDFVKILGRGELKAKLKVTAHQFSKIAAETIQRSGGEVIIL